MLIAMHELKKSVHWIWANGLQAHL